MSGLQRIRLSYAVYVLLSLTFIFISVNSYVYDVYFFGQLCALLGILLFSLQFLLTSRLKLMDRMYGYANIVSIHKLNAKLAFLLIALHPMLLYSFSISKYFRAIPDYSIFGFMGPVSLSLFLLVVVTSMFRKKFKLRYETWRKIHLITYLAITAGFIHGYFMGEHVASTIYLYWYVVNVAMVVGVLFYRFCWVKRHLASYEVFEVTKSAREIYTVSMKPVGNKLNHKAGQFAFVRFLSTAIPDEEHHFTISSAPSDKFLSFSIEAYGDYTKEIINLKKGDKALIEGAFGDLVADGSSEYLFIAGGIGITPIMSIIRDQFHPSLQLRTVSKPKIKLLYSGKKIEDMAFVDELREISKVSSLDLQLFTTEKRQSDVNFGRITDEIVRRAYETMDNPSVYVVGPMSIIKMVETSLRSRSVNKELFEFN